MGPDNPDKEGAMVRPTDVLEIIDNMIFVTEHAMRNGACRATLHNQMLGLRGSCFSLARSSEQPWARSFEMRGEEVESLLSEILAPWQEVNYRCEADCDCNAILERF